MTSLQDLSSSPDPLGDEAPSSIRPITRRTAGNLKLQHRESSLQLPSSIRRARPLSTGKSPRKQTFELDVGNGRSPQRLLVTVEAEEERAAPDGVNRRLFTRSPTRSVSRRRATTKTTVVPLRGLTDDEGGDLGDEPTPRKRGRPRVSLGSKNGTPAPRGKKRAGTPMQKTSRAKRHSGEATSEMALPSDALMEASGNAALDPTPKPKTRSKKTPKKASTPAIPSSKPTGRKRGRPRKALIPEEVVGFTKEAEHQADDADVIPSEDAPIPEQYQPAIGQESDQDRTSADTTNVQSAGKASARSPTLEDTLGAFAGRGELRRSPATSLSPYSIGQASAHQARTESYDGPMFHDFVGEAHSDIESEFDGTDGITYSGQDNLTHASDFSMIAVEALPSFQASFQSSRSALIETEPRYSDAGDETNMIINQTMESYRRSTQSDVQHRSHIEDTQHKVNHNNPVGDHTASPPPRDNHSQFGSSQTSWTRSPRRQQKPVPLSRQVFGTSRVRHVDDSFSSVPDSILQAATPGRLPMKSFPARAAEDDSNMYEDSFSEVPDEVLMAATPRPNRTTNQAGHDEDSDPPSSEAEADSATRSTNIGSDRLPTPDDTNSSATDAKNGRDNDTIRLTGGSSAIVNTSDLNIRSSPPTINKQLNTTNTQTGSAQTISKHFDTMALQSEGSRVDQAMADTPPRKDSSPHMPLTKSPSPEQSQSLQPPAQTRRPTLSPIVRAGRTLQNIISDRSSPDDHGSLGSPFRGSVPNDSRQSSVARSPLRESSHRRAGSDSRSIFNPAASISQRIVSAFGSNQRTESAPASVAVDAALIGEVEDPFGPDMHDYSRTETLRRSGYGTETSQTDPKPSQVGIFPKVPSSARAAAPSEQGSHLEVSSVAGDNDLSSPATQRSRRLSASNRLTNLSAFEARDSQPSRLQTITYAHEDHGLEEEEQAEDFIEEIEEIENDDYLQNHVDDDVEADHQSDQQSEGDQASESSIDEFPGVGDIDTDIWDFEASRATPRSTKALRAEARARRIPQSDGEGPHLAPHTASIDDAAASVADDAEPPRRSKIPSPWRRNTRRLIYQDDFRSQSEIAMEDSPPSDAERTTPAPPAIQAEQPVEQTPRVPQADGKSEEEHVELFRELDDADEEFGNGASYDLMEHDEPLEPEQPTSEPEQHTSDVMLDNQSDFQDYSMVSQHENPPEAAPEKQEPSRPARKSFFGNFDILSFFSSPRPPPTTNVPQRTQVDETPLHQTMAKPLPQSVQSIDKSVAEEPRSALRATGLFPTIRQKTFNPSPQRRVDLFSPGTNLRSNDTVADTYAETPSTPARQEFPSILQKRNFTPLSAQSRNTASLFTPSRQGSSPVQGVQTPSPALDDLLAAEFSGDEDTMLTDGPSFEMIPPREKPSQWDKTLSPIKSSFRSPIKPKTPGRVVGFTSSVLNLEVHAQVRADRQRVLNSVSISNVNIATNNPRTAILNPSPLRVHNAYQLHDQDKENTPSPPKSPEHRPSQLLQPTRPQTIAPAGLSSVAWSRAHWIRLDELLQLRKKDSMQFQMLFPSIAPSKHPLTGLEVATQDAKLVLEDWHLEVVEAFRSELVGGPRPLSENGVSQTIWDAKNLSKRLFALMVGEERRRSGTYVGSRLENGGAAKGKSREVDSTVV